MDSSRKITDLNHKEAQEYFLSEERYYTFDLPEYFTFERLLKKISKKMQRSSDFSLFCKDKEKPDFYENVNYILMSNKDGEYSWRMLQLINPVLYVSLVHNITKEKNWQTIVDRLKNIQENSLIFSEGLPVVTSSEDKKKNLVSKYLLGGKKLNSNQLVLA